MDEHVNNQTEKNSHTEHSQQGCCAQGGPSIDQELKQCLSDRDMWKDKYARLLADFQNFQKRLEKEYAVLKRTMQSDLLLDFLNILDNIDRALAGGTTGQQEWRTGIELVRKEMAKVLEKYGVREMAHMTQFNPTYHDAVTYIKSESHQPGMIVQILQPGYLFGDQILRPAKVSVAQ